jgi:hypothetical protein
MTRITMVLGVAVMAAVVVAVGCGGGSEQPAGEGAPGPAGTQPVDMTFRTDPDPVRTGENSFEVVLRQDGTPVTDATVTTELFMAAMPSMNMPEMRTSAELSHQGDGMYRGTGQVMMAGDWDVTVTAMRGGQELASRKVTVTAQ